MNNADDWRALWDVLDARRIELGMSWREVYAQAPISQRTVTKMRKDGTPISRPEKRAALATALGWKPNAIDLLLSESPPPTSDLEHPLEDLIADGFDSLTETALKLPEVVQALRDPRLNAIASAGAMTPQLEESLETLVSLLDLYIENARETSEIAIEAYPAGEATPEVVRAAAERWVRASRDAEASIDRLIRPDDVAPRDSDRVAQLERIVLALGEQLEETVEGDLDLAELERLRRSDAQ